MTNFIIPSSNVWSKQIEAIQTHLSIVNQLFALLKLYASKFNYGIHGARILEIQKVLYSIRIERLTIIKTLDYLLENPFKLEVINPKRKPINFDFGSCSKDEIDAIYNDLILIFEKYKQFPQSACTEKINRLLKNIKDFTK